VQSDSFDESKRIGCEKARQNEMLTSIQRDALHWIGFLLTQLQVKTTKPQNMMDETNETRRVLQYGILCSPQQPCLVEVSSNLF
jgi:hypothetical protein